jgi:RHH-type proline utilization regulon transcriptional repressor/proline dehydrogenase/delta 1-pyrroline-5-carboxylate dehydrogenase
MLMGVMDELRVGDPADEDTDVGPVIDADARDRIEQYLLQQHSHILHRTSMKQLHGYYVAPVLLEVDTPKDVQREIFGPVLHVCRWKAGELPELINQINSSGYGLTMGVHTRLESTIETVRRLAHVGNLYVNRSMTGAVVGSQPFGGEGLSGTGFKAGGPHYLLRLCTERTVSIDTTAAGGNATLLGNQHG